MPESKPSWQTSTGSQLLAVSTFAYIIGCFWLMKAGNTEAGIAGLAGIFMTFKSVYDNRKGQEQAKNGKEPEKPPEVKPNG